jgi:hypothetical protein
VCGRVREKIWNENGKSSNFDILSFDLTEGCLDIFLLKEGEIWGNGDFLWQLRHGTIFHTLFLNICALWQI